ncbi:molybdopterin converting factor subunit 1 [Galbibacter mesophilus]|uniref:molybdopterin converting factor subunit 1 n=1 Tax=Galbibacter mesophilus TaxID=379069 RepID=UPI00191D946B|nr:molybdopterin converting factor subunit 1 [Galbibacter mesophilus]MCM5661983.1 molybdopterin converting factor subunit 1 [Galbibacter mesophilus]
MNVLLFGITKEIIGSDTLYISVKDNVKDVKSLKSFLNDKYPELKKLSSIAVAVNNKYAKEEDRITIDDEIALIPPVSGG